jgi:uncharacterized protein YciI
MKKTVAVILQPGSHWDYSKGVREQAFWDEHAKFVDDLFARGVIVMAGPFTPEGTGALVILNVQTPEEAHTIYANDPWKHQGILHVAEAREWTIFLDAHDRAGIPVTS